MKQDVKEIKTNLNYSVALVLIAFAIFTIRSEMKDSIMKKEMAENKAEVKTKIAENKATMGRNFTISVVTPIVVSFATKK